VKSESLEEIVRAVCLTDPPPPSSAATTRPAASDLKGDLDTIVLRALRKEPSRRYASVQDLADDIRRHLDGRPVRARPDTLRYRTGKFIRRHRVGVTAAVLVAASLVTGLAATLRQRGLAEAQRLRAERRFAEVRQIANSFLFEFERVIRDLPGSTPARQLVVKKALEYLDGLAQEAAGDPVLQAELANAYQKLCDVQGNPTVANTGDTAGAVASCRKELAIREALAAGGDRPAAHELAAAYRRLGLMEDESGKTGEGIVHLQQALQLGERLRAEDGQDEKARRLLAQAHESAGLLALKTGAHGQAEDHQRRALAIWEAEVQGRPQDREALHGAYVLHGALGRTLRVTGRRPEATRHYRSALEAAQARLRLSPDDRAARRDEAVAIGNLAVALSEQGDFQQATAYMVKALAFDEEMVRDDPKNDQAHRDLAWDCNFLSDMALSQGKLEEALRYQRRTLEIDQARANANPGSFQAHKDLAEAWSAFSDVQFNLRRFDAALENSQRALTLFEELHAANPGHTRLQQLMAAQYGRQGRMLETARRRDACGAYRRGLELWRDLEAKGAGIDDAQRAQRDATEKAYGRCGSRSA
jgi:non-specific serine/threonine protein kinase/serine/threonine-protein kinase